MNSNCLMKSDDLDDTKIDEVAKDVKKSIEKRKMFSSEKLQFLSPLTKVADVLSAAEEGIPLKNRRVLTLMLPDIRHKIISKGKSDKASPIEIGILIRTPYTQCKSPAIWLSSSRWAFLPKSESKLASYRCPESVQRRLEEDIAKLKKEPIKELSKEELLEFYKFLNELADRKAKAFQFKVSGFSLLVGVKKYWKRLQSKV
ncbi:hypothetical protein DFH28DRAFT_1169777 [Melampsora americana]|nr:hypothetical protein DFH28DRAFT_1169777 [Melampsora americana]